MRGSDNDVFESTVVAFTRKLEDKDSRKYLQDIWFGVRALHKCKKDVSRDISFSRLIDWTTGPRLPGGAGIFFLRNQE